MAPLVRESPYQSKIIQCRQMDIKENGIRMQELYRLERLMLVHGLTGDHESSCGQQLADHLSKRVVIIHHKNRHWHQGHYDKAPRR